MALETMTGIYFIYGNETIRIPKFIQEAHGWTPETPLKFKYSEKGAKTKKMVIEEAVCEK